MVGLLIQQAVMSWLVTEAQRPWARHGPRAALVGPLGTPRPWRSARTTAPATTPCAECWPSGGPRLGVEAWQAHFLCSATATHCFDSLEDGIAQAQRACEGLVHGGDPQFACATVHTSTPALLDCASTLDDQPTDVEMGVAFANRTGDVWVRSSPYSRGGGGVVVNTTTAARCSRRCFFVSRRRSGRRVRAD